VRVADHVCVFEGVAELVCAKGFVRDDFVGGVCLVDKGDEVGKVNAVKFKAVAKGSAFAVSFGVFKKVKGACLVVNAGDFAKDVFDDVREGWVAEVVEFGKVDKVFAGSGEAFFFLKDAADFIGNACDKAAVVVTRVACAGVDCFYLAKLFVSSLALKDRMVEDRVFIRRNVVVPKRVVRHKGAVIVGYLRIHTPQCVLWNLYV